VNISGLEYDHSGKYGEYAEFSYTPAGVS